MFFYRTEQSLGQHEKDPCSFACGFFRLVHLELGFYYFKSVVLRVEIYFLCGLFRNVARQNYSSGSFSANFVNRRVKAYRKLSRASAQAERL